MHWVDNWRPGGAAILPILNDDSIICVRQYRQPLDKYTLEIPRGGREPGDRSSKDAAIRELEEETGYRVTEADRVKKLGHVAPDSAIMRRVCPIYVVRLTDEDRAPNANINEVSSVEIIPFSKLGTYIVSGDIECGMTLAAILQAWLIHQNGRFVDPT